MTLEDIEKSLPNGLHDAVILELVRDYEHALVKLKIEVLIELPEGTDKKATRYRAAEILFSGVPLCTVEVPDPKSAYRHPGCIWFSFSKMSDGVWPEEIGQSLPPGTLLYSLFILDWWSHIHIAAKDVTFSWADPSTAREIRRGQ